LEDAQAKRDAAATAVAETAAELETQKADAEAAVANLPAADKATASFVVEALSSGAEVSEVKAQVSAEGPDDACAALMAALGVTGADAVCSAEVVPTGRKLLAAAVHDARVLAGKEVAAAAVATLDTSVYDVTTEEVDAEALVDELKGLGVDTAVVDNLKDAAAAHGAAAESLAAAEADVAAAAAANDEAVRAQEAADELLEEGLGSADDDDSADETALTAAAEGFAPVIATAVAAFAVLA